MNQKQLDLIRARALNALSVTPDNVDAKDKLALLAEIDHLRGVIAKRWIPVAERLPEVQVDVLVKGGGRYEIANYAPFCATPSWPYEWFATGKALIMDITHWQPLPDGPEVANV